MSDLDTIALNLARASHAAATLLYDAICNGCRTCAAQISDLNRQAALDLSDAERRCLATPEESAHAMPALIGLGECVARAFPLLCFCTSFPIPCRRSVISSPATYSFPSTPNDS